MQQQIKEQIDYIANHIDGLDIVKAYIDLKPVGDLYRSKCPFHHERTPSFTVYPKGHVNSSRQQQNFLSYYCFGCGATGNVVNFIHNIEGHDTYEETFKFFEDNYNITFGEDEQLLELIEQVNTLENTSTHVMSINEINMHCSSYCRRYMFEVMSDYPHLFNQEFDYLQGLYKWMDDCFDNKSAVELQEIFDEVAKKINNRRIFIEK